MKRILGVLFLGVSVFAADDNAEKVDENNETFTELDEPAKYISGAFGGVGCGPTFVSHRVDAHNGTMNLDKVVKKSATQYDVSFLFGFGTLFYKNYYAGILFDITHRFGKGKSYDGDIGFKFNRQFGINMDVRFGYLLPRQGIMVFTTVGFARTLGKVEFKNADGNSMEAGFGSYFPTLGAGAEYKINHLWNVGACAKYSITSKDSREMEVNGHKWNLKAKPSAFLIRVYLMRSII